MKAELLRLGWFLEKTHDLHHLHSHLEAKGSALAPLFNPLMTEYTDVYFMARYPGFDLEEANWVTFREHVEEAERLINAVRRTVG